MSYEISYLPDELWLQVLSHLPASSAWLCLRSTSRQLRACIEDRFLNKLLPCFTISLTYALGSGNTPRWYDASPKLAYARLNKLNQQYALFQLDVGQPDRTAERTREKWKRMCADGLGRELDWRVRFSEDEEDTKKAQSWRVRFGIDEPSEYGQRIKMRRLVVGERESVWVDWKEMVGGYFRQREDESRQIGMVEVESKGTTPIENMS